VHQSPTYTFQRCDLFRGDRASGCELPQVWAALRPGNRAPRPAQSRSARHAAFPKNLAVRVNFSPVAMLYAPTPASTLATAACFHRAFFRPASAPVRGRAFLSDCFNQAVPLCSGHRWTVHSGRSCDVFTFNQPRQQHPRAASGCSRSALGTNTWTSSPATWQVNLAGPL